MENKPLAKLGISQKRDKVSSILSECFSRDLMELEEYEKRIEKVHSCRTIQALDVLISDVPHEIIEFVENETFSLAGQRENLRVSLDYGNQKICGTRLAVKTIDVTAKGSNIKLDFRNIAALPRTIQINLKISMSNLKIIIPPHITAEDILSGTGSTIRNNRHRKFNTVPVTTVLHINGEAKYSVVKIKTCKDR